MLASLYLMNVLKNQMMLIPIAKRHLTKSACSRNEVIWTVHPLRKSPILLSEVTYRGRKSIFSQWTNIWPKSSTLKCQFPDLNGTHMTEEKRKRKCHIHIFIWPDLFKRSIGKESPKIETTFSGLNKTCQLLAGKLLFFCIQIIW